MTYNIALIGIYSLKVSNKMHLLSALVRYEQT